jgi:hypothetical protein
MRHLLLSAAIFCTALLVLLSEAGFAQTEPTPSSTPELELTNILAWATTEPINWSLGALLAVVGFAGALVSIFGLVGGVVPGTAGQARIDEDYEQLKRLSKRLEDLITPNPPISPLDSQSIAAVGQAIKDLRDNLSKERRYQFAIAATLYAVLGAFFASALAQDLLQALVIGAGWTGLAGTLGLKKDFAVRKSSKDSALDASLSTLQRLNESQQSLLRLYLNTQGVTDRRDQMQLAGKPDIQNLVDRTHRLESDVEHLEGEVSLAKAL